MAITDSVKVFCKKKKKACR